MPIESSNRLEFDGFRIEIVAVAAVERSHQYRNVIQCRALDVAPWLGSLPSSGRHIERTKEA